MRRRCKVDRIQFYGDVKYGAITLHFCSKLKATRIFLTLILVVDNKAHVLDEGASSTGSSLLPLLKDTFVRSH